MDFDDTENEIQPDDSLVDDELDEDEEELDLDNEVIGDKKSQQKHQLDVRRAIEDHLENTRLRKELDYLFDDDFGIEEEDNEEN